MAKTEAETKTNELVPGTLAYYTANPTANVTLTVPPQYDDDRNDVVVIVNGRSYQIIRGIPVQLPYYVAAAVLESIKQDKRTKDKLAKMTG